MFGLRHWIHRLRHKQMHMVFCAHRKCETPFIAEDLAAERLADDVDRMVWGIQIAMYAHTFPQEVR